MQSTEGHQKTFSTCAAHLTAVILSYGTATFFYVMPKSTYSEDQNKVVSGQLDLGTEKHLHLP